MMSTISDYSKIKDLLNGGFNADLNADVQSKRAMTDTTESYLYLSTDSTRSEYSIGEQDDLSLDKIHFLLEKAKSLQDDKHKTPRESKVIDMPTTTPVHNLNFKPNLNLLEKHQRQSPLSQSTPLISQLIQLEIPSKNVLRHIFKNGVDDHRFNDVITRSPELSAILEEKLDASDLNDTGYLSPEQTPPSSGEVDTHDDELENLKSFLSKSEMGKQLLQEFESQKTGMQTPPISAPLAFTRSSTSTPQKTGGIDTVTDNDETLLEEKNLLINQLENEIDNKIELIDNLQNKISELQKNNDNYEKRLNEFLIAIIGDSQSAITKEFLSENHCDTLYDSLNLSKIDNSTFIDLQNTLKEITLTLQIPYTSLQDVILAITKFFQKDYLRLILFIRDLHQVIYSSKLVLPDVYTLNWINNGQYDDYNIKDFENCLNQMVNTVNYLKKLTLI